MDELRRRIEEHKQGVIDICGPDIEEDEDPVDYLLYYLSEASDAMTDWLKERGLFTSLDPSGAKCLHFDRSRFDEISKMAGSIIDEYDSVNGDPWEEFGLSGDDDVDYNGGYILIVVGVLELLDQ